MSLDEGIKESELIILARKGDIEAQRYVLRVIDKITLSLILRFNMTIQDAEDIQTSVFRAVIDSYKSNESKLKNYIYKITRNMFIDKYRCVRRRQRQNTSNHETLDRLLAKPKDTIDVYEEQEDVNILRRIIRRTKLTKNQRNIVWLFLRGEQMNEIAQKLRIPEGTVKSSLYLAKRLLKQHYLGWINSFESIKEPMTYIFMNHSYIYNTRMLQTSSKKTNLDSILSDIDTFFKKNAGNANSFLYKNILNLDDIESQRKLEMLARITDNDSTILGNDYSNVTDKMDNHLKLYEEIEGNTKLTKTQRKIYNLYTLGYNPEQIAQVLQVKTQSIIPSLTLIRIKLKVSAIELFREGFEKNCNYSELRRETLSDYLSGKKFHRFSDRYFRIKLGIILLKIAQENNWNIRSLHEHSDETIKYLGYLTNAFNNNANRLINFTQPELLQIEVSKQRNTKGRNYTRTEAFRFIEDILYWNGSVLLHKGDYYSNPDLGGILRRYFAGSIKVANKAYLKQYLKGKLHLEEDSFLDYTKNFKLLALVFESPPFNNPIVCSDDDILSLNRREVYSQSNLSAYEIDLMELLLSNWDYNFRDIGIGRISEKKKIPYFTLTYRFKRARKKLQETIRSMYVNR